MLIGLVACGPDQGKEPKGDEAKRYAEKACGAMAECGCYAHFGTTEACKDELEDRFAAFVADGLSIDLDCFAFVEEINDCTPTDFPPNEWRCDVLLGNKKVGDSCTDRSLEIPPFGVEECDEGLACSNGTCKNAAPKPELIEGAPCAAEESSSCGNLDLYCGPEGVCRATELESEPCDSPWACSFDIDEDDDYGRGLYCAGFFDDAGGTCSRQPVVGEPCNPRDYNACIEGLDLDTRNAWCDPAQSVCVAEGPGICYVADFPKARPWMP